MDNALSAFLETECSLILSDVSEPNICQRMSFYLQQAANASGFGDYFADTECNRKQDGEIKTIIDERDIVVSIRCDLLLHERGEMGPQENLIAIEVKKAGRPRKSLQVTGTGWLLLQEIPVVFSMRCGRTAPMAHGPSMCADTF